MNPEARKLLDKSGRAIHAAEVLLREGDTDFAVGRAYYAMFYAVEALLIARGHRFSKHGAVHAAFGEQFAKPGLLDPKYHRWLLGAFNARIAGDSGVEASLSSEAVATVIARSARVPRTSPPFSREEPMTDDRRLIEDFLPIQAISAEGRIENSVTQARGYLSKSLPSIPHR